MTDDRTQPPEALAPAHYCDPVLVALYDLEDIERADFGFYLELAERRGMRVLDVGCGTGALALRFADRGHCVTGLDPAAAMLDCARRKPGAETVTWIAGDARTFAMPQRFDLIVMTGNAFQTLLSDADQIAALANMGRHLAEDGRIAVETRNPDVAEWRHWTPDAHRELLQHPALGPVDVHWQAYPTAEPEIIALETHYLFQASGARRVSHSRLRFAPLDTLSRTIAAAGLEVEHWYCDWQRQTLHDRCLEYIPVIRRPRKRR
jgi:ubiquinone/menaquinone biosynthesis C-methylase UbiE